MRFCLACIALPVLASASVAETPRSVLDNIFPSGCRIGSSTEIALKGDNLGEVSGVRSSHSGIVFEKVADNRFKVTVSQDTPSGIYDVQAVGSNGLSSTRAFFVTHKQHVVSSDSDPPKVQSVAMDSAISGRIHKKGEVDQYQFAANRGERIVIECWAERIDSALRAILELFDSNGKLLASNRGYFGIDPALCFPVEEDGSYVVRVYDLVYAGSENHFYRLDIGSGPRVVFALPPVLQRSQATPVTLFGWNLHRDKRNTGGFESLDVNIVADAPDSTLPWHRQPPEALFKGVAHHLPGADSPAQLGITDVPVVLSQFNNRSADTALPVSVPCEVVGQLRQGDAQDWYAIDVKRGEVIHLETIGARMGSPVDLDAAILDADGAIELASFHDELVNAGGIRFPSNHSDASGRWVAPRDGRYLILIRNLTGGLTDDPRRVYRLVLRREEPDVHLVALAHDKSKPASINLRKGGRQVVDILAFRRRGLSGSVRVSAVNLPPGVRCPSIWIGPDVECAPLVLTADHDAGDFAGNLELVGHWERPGVQINQPVLGGTMVRTGLPNGSGRLTTDIPLAVSGKSHLQVTANGHETREHHLYGQLKVRHSPGGILDVAVSVERSAGNDTAVNLVGVGLPDLIENQASAIPPGQSKGYISFYLPPTLPVGRYTIAIRAQTSITLANKSTSATAYSDPVTFDVYPPAFRVQVHRDSPKQIRRGEIVQVKYSARRINGFISKIHTELAAPGRVRDVGDLRGRGVTFVGQTDTGSIQVIANEDAQLGQQQFLRLYAVGVLEDQAAFHGSCFLHLEVVK